MSTMINAATGDDGSAGTNGQTEITAAQIMQGTAGAMGSLMDVRRGRMEAAQLRQQSRFESIRANIETTQATEQASGLRQKLNRNLAAQRAAASVSGLAGESGAIRTGAEASADEGGRAIQQIQAGARVQRTGRLIRAQQMRRDARFARRTGRARAQAGLLQSFGQQIAMGSTAGMTQGEG